MKNIVIIGGGTGTFTLLSGLRQFPSNNTVIVASSDDGGSAGRLRKELGVFPPGDLRQCLVGLSYTEALMKEMFLYRFDKGSLAGHTAGNIILAALEKMTGSVEKTIEIASKILNVRGQVLPVTLKPTRLSAVLENGQKIIGEHNIDEPRIHRTSPIASMALSPKTRANIKALKALAAADVIIFGPGDLYTGIVPNLLVSGVKEAVNKSKAKKILVSNIMTKHGQSDGFTASVFVEELQKYLGGKIDAVVVNSKKPDFKLLNRYRKEKAEFVKIDRDNLKKQNIQIFEGALLSTETFEKPSGDVLIRSFLRHDSQKTAKIIWQLIN